MIDAGARFVGGVSAGLKLAEICMGGLGEVSLASDAATPNWPWSVAVRSSNPVTACFASQYAGWRLAHGEGKDAFFALGSGPGRALARKEALFGELIYADAASEAVLVIESDRAPPAPVVAKVAADCGLEPSRLTVPLCADAEPRGGCQVVARVLEVALHKAHELKFPLDRIVDGMGVAPLPPPHPDFVTAMGRTNDAIIYAGRVHLFVTGPAADARGAGRAIAEPDFARLRAPVCASCFGSSRAISMRSTPCCSVPAEVIVTAIEFRRELSRRCDAIWPCWMRPSWLKQRRGRRSGLQRRPCRRPTTIGTHGN